MNTFCRVYTNCLFLLFISGNVFSQSNLKRDTVSAKKYCAEGIGNYESENFEHALISFNRAINSDPNNYKYYSLRAQTYGALEKFDLAIKDINNAIFLNPKNSRSYELKGLLENTMRNYKDAVESFTMLVKLRPKYIKAYYLRASSYRSLKKNQEALNDFNFVILKRGDSSDYQDRGLINYDLENYAAAINDFNSYLKLGGKEVIPIYYYRGISYFNTAKYDSAAIDLNSYLKMHNPPNVNVLNRLGLSYAQFGDTLNARTQFVKSLEIDKENPETYNFYSITEELFGNCKHAKDLCNKYATMIGEKNLDAYFFNNRALINNCLGDTAAALADYNQSIKLDPKNYKPYFNRIVLLFNDTVKTNIVLKDIDYLIPLLNDSAFTPYLYSIKAFIKLRSIDSLGTIENLLLAKKTGKRKAFTYYNLAGFYFILSVSDNTCRAKVVENLNEAISIDPAYLGSYKLLANFYFYMNNDINKACEIVTTGLKFGTDEQLIIMKKFFCGKGKKEKDKFPINKISFFDLPYGENPLFSQFLNEINKLTTTSQHLP